MALVTHLNIRDREISNVKLTCAEVYCLSGLNVLTLGVGLNSSTSNLKACFEVNVTNSLSSYLETSSANGNSTLLLKTGNSEWLMRNDGQNQSSLYFCETNSNVAGFFVTTGGVMCVPGTLCAASVSAGAGTSVWTLSGTDLSYCDGTVTIGSVNTNIDSNQLYIERTVGSASIGLKGAVAAGSVAGSIKMYGCDDAAARVQLAGLSYCPTSAVAAAECSSVLIENKVAGSLVTGLLITPTIVCTPKIICTTASVVSGGGITGTILCGSTSVQTPILCSTGTVVAGGVITGSTNVCATLCICAAGAGCFGGNVNSAGIVNAATCFGGPILCATTNVQSPILCSTGTVAAAGIITTSSAFCSTLIAGVVKNCIVGCVLTGQLESSASIVATGNVQGAILCGTTCITSAILCGPTSIHSPTVCASGAFVGSCWLAGAVGSTSGNIYTGAGLYVDLDCSNVCTGNVFNVFHDGSSANYLLLVSEVGTVTVCCLCASNYLCALCGCFGGNLCTANTTGSSIFSASSCVTTPTLCATSNVIAGGGCFISNVCSALCLCSVGDTCVGGILYTISGIISTDNILSYGAVHAGYAGTGNGFMRLGPTAPSANGWGGIRMVNSNTQYNWLVGHNVTVSGVFEIIPSTLVGGEVFSTPALKVCANGSTITTISCAANCVISPYLCAPTFLYSCNICNTGCTHVCFLNVSSIICTAGVVCSATGIVSGAYMSAGTYVYGPIICATCLCTPGWLYSCNICNSGCIAACFIAVSSIICSTTVCVTQSMCAGVNITGAGTVTGNILCVPAYVHALCVIASACMCVGVAPSSTNHVTPKCYVDAVAGSTLGTVQHVDLGMASGNAGTSVAITQVTCTSSYMIQHQTATTNTGTGSLMAVIQFACAACCICGNRGATSDCYCSMIDVVTWT